MKKLFFLCLLFKSASAHCQDISVFIKSPGTKKLTVKEFKEQEILQMTDSTLKVYSYVIYFACDNEYHKPNEKGCDISVAQVSGNSLKAESVVEMTKIFTTHFYIVLDNVKCIDKNGNIRVLATPGRIDITE